MEYVLRDYQTRAVSAALTSLSNKDRGILVLPTGAGKSLVIASIAKEAGGRTLILQPSKEILEQNKRKIHDFGFWNIGTYSASCGRKDIGQITLATIGSIVNKKELFKNFDRIIIDECHLVNSQKGMYEDFINHLKLPLIGLTATPYRMKNYVDGSGGFVTESQILTRTRPRIFNKIAHVTQVRELFDAGFLCKLDYEWENDYDSRQVRANSTGAGYDERALLNYNQAQGITDKIIDIVTKSTKKHLLIFTQFRKESARVLSGLNALGISCAEVSAESTKQERESILWGFTHGTIRSIVNVGVLTTGFDFPELDCIVLGRPTKSVALYYQMTGRGIRIAKDKESCALVDLCDNVKRFGKIETFEIYDSNNNEVWRLKSNIGNLTGVDVTSGHDREKSGVPKRAKARADEIIPTDVKDGIIVTFGKFAGKKVQEINTAYLEWATREFSEGKWKTIFSEELLRRKAV